MKFFIFVLLVLAYFEGILCAPFLEIFVPETSQMTYGRRTTFDIPKLAHFENNGGFDWKVKWPERNPRPHYDYPPQDYGYPQQYHNYNQQYEDYPQREPYNKYGGQY